MKIRLINLVGNLEHETEIAGLSTSDAIIYQHVRVFLFAFKQGEWEYFREVRVNTVNSYS